MFDMTYNKIWCEGLSWKFDIFMTLLLYLCNFLLFNPFVLVSFHMIVIFRNFSQNFSLFFLLQIPFKITKNI